MKSWILIPVVALAFGAFAMPAKAVMLGQASAEALLQPGNDIEVQLFNLTNTSLVNVHKTVSTNNNVYKFGNTFYFTNSFGLYKTTVGNSAITLVKAGETFEAVGKIGSMLLVSDNMSKHRSFLYDTKAQKLVPLNRAVNSITNASFTANGKRMALIGTNTSGKQKVFISTTSLRLLREVSLPKNASACSVAQLSPDGSQLVIGCYFTMPDKSTEPGFVVARVTNGILGGQRFTMNHKLMMSGIWISNQTFVSVDAVSSGNTLLTARTITNGAVRKTSLIALGQVSITESEAVSTIPTLVAPGANTNEFYYEFVTLRITQDTATYSSQISRYNLATKKKTMVRNDGTYMHLIEAR